MKYLLFVLFCCLASFAFGQIPVDHLDTLYSMGRNKVPDPEDSSLSILHHWQDSLCLDKKTISLMKKFNGYLNEYIRNNVECDYKIKEAGWWIERGEQIKATECIKEADNYHKAADRCKQKSDYYLSQLKNHCKI